MNQGRKPCDKISVCVCVCLLRFSSDWSTDHTGTVLLSLADCGDNLQFVVRTRSTASADEPAAIAVTSSSSKGFKARAKKAH